MTCQYCDIITMKYLSIFISLLLYQSIWSWNRPHFRDPKLIDSYLNRLQSNTKIPHVPFSNRGKEHKVQMGRNWNFEQTMSRQAGNQRFQSEPLVNGIPYGKSGYARSATLYDIEITESQLLFLNIMTNGGSGDVDIYVKRDDFPTKSNYDVRSAHPGNQEQIIIQNPVPGRYYIVLYGYESYSMVGFEAEYR